MTVWDTRYAELLHFVTTYQKMPSKTSDVHEEKTLAFWIAGQKTAYKNNKLDSQKVEKLELIPNWQWSKTNWYETFVHVAEYYKNNKVYPSRNSSDEQEKKLGLWLHSQRQRRFKLSPEQQYMLEGLPEWFWSHEDRWYIRYHELLIFVNSGGKLTTRPSTKRMYEWYSKQKRNYDKLNARQQKLINHMFDEAPKDS